jgi:type VI secretion system secreted protein Hcp
MAPGIPGESADGQHEGEIELKSFSWGATRPETISGGGAAGRVQFGELLVTIALSKASPALMHSCATGERHEAAVLTAPRAGIGKQEFQSVTMSDLVISSYQTSGSTPSEVVLDQVSLRFSRIRMSYRPQKEDGSLGEPVAAGWDVTENRPV